MEINKLNKINFEIQKSLPIIYKGTKLDCGYMKLAKIEIGLLINFNERLLKNGIQRFAL